MANNKGFSREHDPTLLSSGKLHEPDLRRKHDLSIYSGEDEPNQDHIDSLLSGYPVVHESHVGHIRRSMDAVTLNKIIESKRSAHGVGFGSFRLIGGIAAGASVERQSIPVAFKPFNGPEKALHEMYGYGVLRAMGIETFDPIGVFPARHGDHFVLASHKRNDLMSLDRDHWVIGGYVKDRESAETVERNSEVVKGISEMLGYLHVHGVHHPDGQIKNWSVTPEGDIGVIDTENLIAGQANGPDAVNLAWNDIEKLVKSLVFANTDEETKLFGVGMFAGMSVERVRSQIESLIINPYINSIFSNSLHSETSNPDILDHAEALISGVQKTFDNNPDWPGHIIAMQHVAHEVVKQSIIRP